MPGMTKEAARTRFIDFDYEFDAAPGSVARVGLVLLATDLATEREIMRVMPSLGPHGDAVAWFVDRVKNANPTSVANLRRMAEELPLAASRLLPDERLDAIAFSCTSGTIVNGEETVFARLAEGRPGVPATTPITAAKAGFAALGVKRIAVLTPYLDEVNEVIRSHLEDHGFAVTGLTSFNLASDADMAALSAPVVQRAAREADTTDADALFISCTSLQAVTSIAPLEEALGKPVVTSNQALFWHALRLAGVDTPIDGFGRLLTL